MVFAGDSGRITAIRKLANYFRLADTPRTSSISALALQSPFEALEQSSTFVLLATRAGPLF